MNMASILSILFNNKKSVEGFSWEGNHWLLDVSTRYIDSYETRSQIPADCGYWCYWMLSVGCRLAFLGSTNWLSITTSAFSNSEFCAKSVDCALFVYLVKIVPCWSVIQSWWMPRSVVCTAWANIVTLHYISAHQSQQQSKRVCLQFNLFQITFLGIEPELWM